VLKRFVSEDPIGLAGGDLNFYRYVYGNPANVNDPTGLLGLGGYVSAAAEAGVGPIGLGAQGFAGAGVFGGGSRGMNLGAFGGAGAFPANLPGQQGVVGAYAGLGAGVFLTNATSAAQLCGWAYTFSLNLPIASFQLGVDPNSGTWIATGTMGPAVGASASLYQVKTSNATCGCPQPQ
jgi:uncharacterized protein RhaS with RHS repeats